MGDPTATPPGPDGPGAPGAAGALALASFIDACPTPYHVVAEVARRLDAVGFTALDEADRWDDVAGDRYLVRGGTLIAWRAGGADALDGGIRLVGAHTDSPNLRLKPHPDTGRAGYRQVGVEVYGGALWNSWLDRDLGIAGRLVVDDPDAGPDGLRTVLVHLDEPLLRIPQLAIHLDRGVNEHGLSLNAQQHLQPLWGLGAVHPGAVLKRVAAAAGVAPASVTGFDLMCHDTAPSQLLGFDRAFLSAPRLDNQLSCWAGLEALLARPAGADGVAMLALFDHEEVGSASASGAAGAVLAAVVERVVHGLGGDRDDVRATLARSWCVSADGAHATNPNYADRHDPAHVVVPNAGPVLKHNANERYATDAASAALFRRCCARAGVPVQEFVMRSDLPCGSTIGPLTASMLGIRTVDVGAPQLAMHSARELCGADDPALLARALGAFLAP